VKRERGDDVCLTGNWVCHLVFSGLASGVAMGLGSSATVLSRRRTQVTQCYSE